MSPDSPLRSGTGPRSAGAREAHRRQAGYTLLEVIIALSILTTMALITEKALISTARTQRYLAAVSKVTDRGHRLTYEIREKVTSSRRIFFDDDIGNDFLGSMDLTREPMVSWARLPAVDDAGRLGPDKVGDPKTGNVLFFVGETDATAAIADPDKQSVRYIDTYHFVCVYPRETERYVLVAVNKKRAIDLVVWQSEEVPDYAQIMAISDLGQRGNVIDDLKANHGHEYAWDPTGVANSSFYALDDLRVAGPTPRGSVVVSEDGARSRGGRLVYANVQLARADIDEKRRRPIFSTQSPATWLPHGFEVKIVGPTGARQVWYHLVVEAQSGMGEIAVHSSTMVANARDL